MKKLIALMMTLCLIAGIAVAVPAMAETKSPDKVKIGIISNTTAQDGGWGTGLWNSVVRVKEALGLSDDQVIWCESIYDGTPDVDNMISVLVDEGCDVIMGHSAGYVDQFAAAAQKYPDVYFTAYECTVEGQPNFALYSISDEAASFLCGYAAARMSKGDEIGYIGNMPTSDLICCLDSFSVGAKYANPNAKIKIVWINSWYDPATEKSAAEAMIQEGITSIGYMGSTASVAQACGEAGIYTTGMYIDMYDYAPNAVLTSHVYDWDLILTEILNRVAEDRWTSEPILYTFKDGAAKVGKVNTDVMPEDVVNDFNELAQKLQSGEMMVFSGPLFDNAGNQIAAEGEVLTGEALITVDFLVDNIEGQIP